MTEFSNSRSHHPPLHNIATKIGSGATPRGGKNSYKTEGISLIRSLNIYDFRFEYSNLAFIDEAQADGLSNVVVEPQDILLNITGASVGRCSIVPFRVLPARVNQHVAIVRIDKTKADAYYVLCCINSPRYKDGLLKIAQGGATREALTKEKIETFEIPVPPLPIQRKIASILFAYDDLIENNLRRIKILEEMAQSLYREWFVKFRFPGHEKVRMVVSPLGKIPEGWEVKTLGELTDVVTKGTTPTTLGKSFQAEGINFFKVESIDEGGGIIEEKLAKIDAETHKLLKRSQLQAGDILFSIAGAIGRTAMLPLRALPANTNQALAIIRVSEETIRTYVYHSVCADSFQDFSLGRVVQTAQANVSLGILKSAPLVIPTGAVLLRFIEMVSSMRLEQENLRTRNANLRQTRNLLLPKLISGKLDVSNLDINIAEETA